MKKKRLLVLLLLVVIVLGQIGITNFLNASYAETRDVTGTKWNRYFYEQLTPNAKAIYEAMFKMYQDGKFMRGESLEITDKVSSASIALFVNGDNQLILDYAAARDAFQYDYPDCFYVDFSQLSVRVTQSSDGTLHAFLGAGRSDTYWLPEMDSSRTTEDNGGFGEGIEGAVEQYNAKMDEIIEQIVESVDKNKELEGGEVVEKDSEGNVLETYTGSNRDVLLVGAAHDYLVKHMIYHFENEVKNGNARTAYDGIIYGEGVCEAYTRSFKAILDRLGIPCVCVYGIYTPKQNVNEPHIWNYVQIGGKWYGVDVTHDDPTHSNWTEKNSGHETRQYWLVGSRDLVSHHYPQGIMSGANYKFTYPNLEEDALRENYTVQDSNFRVKVVKEIIDYDRKDDFNPVYAGVYEVNYNGKNYTENAKDGKYLIARYIQYEPGTDTWTTTDWMYLDPWAIYFGDSESSERMEPTQPDSDLGGNYVRVEAAQIRKAQFAVTDIAPKYKEIKDEYEQNGYNKENYTQDWYNRFVNVMVYEAAAFFDGSTARIEEKTNEIDNEWGTYVAPPYPKKCTPSTAGALTVGQKQHITITFDCKLVLEEGATEAGIEFSTEKRYFDNDTGDKFGTVANFEFDGDRTVEFDFTPSDMFADDSCFYDFQVTGLVGEASLQKPIPVSYMAVFPCAMHAFAAEGYQKNIFGQPQLIDSTEIDGSDWEMKDMETGKSSVLDDLEKLTHRLTLVTSETTKRETEAMQDVLQNADNNTISSQEKAALKEAEELERVNTYNIKFTVCKKYIVQTGEGVRISVGFPKGTSYEDYAKDGKLSFKAYHYIVDPETDVLTGEVEEIPVTVTRQGLILLVKSFSPFTIAAIENPEPIVPVQKQLVVTSTEGGSIKNGATVLEGGKGDITLNKDGKATLTITPDAGYEIDYIMIDNVRKNITNKSGETIEISYDEVETGSVIEVGFVSAKIHTAEKVAGYSSDYTVPKITIAIDKDIRKDYLVGEKIEIAPVVTVTGIDYDEIKYQWEEYGGRPYPLGQPLEGQNNKNLVIESAKLSDGIAYQLRVTLIKGGKKVLHPDSSQELVEISEVLKLYVYPEMNIDILDNEENKIDTLSLKEGDTYQLKTEIYRIYDDGYETKNKVNVGRTVTWTSINPDVVTVDSSGLLEAVGVSTEPVTIKAEIEDVDGSKKIDTITVNVKHVPVESVSISPAEATVDVGKTLHLTAEISPENATNKDVTWSMKNNDNSHATVDEHGVVTGIKEGTATVVATAADGKTAECKVTVNTPPVTDITDDIEDHDIELVAGSTITIHANAHPHNADNELKWETSDSTVATVEKVDGNNGKITAGAYKESGNNTCTITVSSVSNPSVKLEYHITVIDEVIPVDHIELNSKNVTLKVGEHFDFNVEVFASEEDTAKGENPTFTDIKWAITDLEGEDVAIIDDSGVVVANNIGKAKVTVTVTCANPECPKHTAEATVTVEKTPVTDIKLSETSIELHPEHEHQLYATVLPEDATDKTVTWESLNEDIATVDENGKVVAVATGTATIRVSSVSNPTVYKDCKVKVLSVPVEDIELSKKDLVVKGGEETIITATVSPSTATNKELTWKADSDVVTLDVTDDGEGKYTVTIKVSDVTEKTQVTITATATDGSGITETLNVTVVPSKGDLTVYTVDQNGNFMPGVTLRLMQGDTLISEGVATYGMFKFEDLPDGEYTISEVHVPVKDLDGNNILIEKIIENYTFRVVEGKVEFINVDEEEFTDTLVFVNIVNDGNSADLLARIGVAKDFTTEDGKTIEEQYKEFSEKYAEKETDQPSKPDQPDTPDTPTTPDVPDTSEQPDNPTTPDVPDTPEQPDNPTTPDVPDTPEQPDNGNNGSGMPNTSDIAIEVFAVVMIISLIGIIFIIRKKNVKGRRRK